MWMRRRLPSEAKWVYLQEIGWTRFALRTVFQSVVALSFAAIATAFLLGSTAREFSWFGLLLGNVIVAALAVVEARVWWNASTVHFPSSAGQEGEGRKEIASSP
jgi:hypothetical protein